MRELARFTTDPETCPYLGDRDARMEYLLVDELTAAEYAERLAAGWRRFGHAIFRPRCGSCRECVPIRVSVDRFRPSKGQRRVLRRNEDVRVEIGEPMIDAERLDLYRRHHAEREVSRGWKPSGLDVEEYFETFVFNSVPTLEFRYRVDGALAAVAYVGEAADAFNSIYGFYDPEYGRRGLGNFDVLTEIGVARSLGKKWVYLGFFVAGCPSMAYKVDFRPYELLVDGDWRAEGREPSDSGADTSG